MESRENSYQIKVNLPGGIVSVGDFLLMLNILEKTGIDSLCFGTRQQLYFSATSPQLEDVKHGFVSSGTDFEINADKHPNIVSSYVAEDLFNSANWLREGVYKDILDNFNYMPRLKINLVDESQTLIPFFTGNLNFLSSDIGNYWHLYIRLPKTNTIFNWSSLVYSEDIALLSEVIENIILDHTDLYDDLMAGQNLERMVRAKRSFLYQEPLTPLKIPDFQLPYYEGFNKYDEKYWLGIYRRNELFSVAFLQELCNICCKTRIGQIYTTPWKSIIVKGVEPADRKLWNAALDKNRINVRHASNELNWQTEDLCAEGLELKYELISAFNEIDLRTFKLSFAIKINPQSGLFGSVIIRKQVSPNAASTDSVFDVLHTVDFNPNSKQYHTFARNLSKNDLMPALIHLCNDYYQLQNPAAGITADHDDPHHFVEPETTYMQQCGHCLSIYDEDWGDESRGIAAGTPFSALPEDYCCPLCEADRADFNAIIKNVKSPI